MEQLRIYVRIHMRKTKGYTIPSSNMNFTEKRGSGGWIGWDACKGGEVEVDLGLFGGKRRYI